MMLSPVAILKALADDASTLAQTNMAATERVHRCSSTCKAHSALLTSDPLHQDGAPGAEDGAKTEDRQMRRFGEVVDFAPAAGRAEDEGGDRVGAAEQVVREGVVGSVCGVCCGCMMVLPVCC